MRIVFRQGLFSAVMAASLLVACSTPRESTRPTSNLDISDAATASEQVAEAETESSQNIESVYTSLALEDCETLEVKPEGNVRALRCEGYEKIPLYVTEGDGRFDVDAGMQNDRWTTNQRPFNSVGDTVEWRIRDGEPIAAILRFNFMAGDIESARSSELAVLSIGRDGSPGCLVDWVEADAQPGQNEAARQLADEQADGFDCDPQAEREAQLPASLLGTFDQTQEECAKTMTMNRLTLSPDKFDFYYGYADVNAVTPRAGGYDVDATFYQQEGAVEVIPTPAEYRIEPDTQGDRIQLEWVSEGLEKSSLVRCNES